MDAVTLHHGDALDVLRGMADNSVDAVVTDPPYGLSDHDADDVAEALGCWLRGEEYHHGRGGFMGRSWDEWVPGPSLWREVYRVLKPGGHLLCFAGTRTQDLMGIAIRLAGFECRDTLQWLYGSGFPKSHDVSKAIDKAAGVERDETPNPLSRPTARSEKVRQVTHSTHVVGQPKMLTAPATDAARQWDGWGTALKPAHEPILVFRKPLVGTVAANVQAWGTGALHIEACRVGTESAYTQEQWTQKGASRTTGSTYGVHRASDTPVPAGRWPANVVLSHAPGCQRVGTRRVRGGNGVRGSDAGNTMYGGGKGMNRPTTGQTVGYADADGLETVDNFACVDGCPVKALAEQSGERPGMKPAVLRRGATTGASIGGHGRYGTAAPQESQAGYGDTGTAARFFPNFEPSPLDALDAPWLYTAKASRREREAGLEGMEKRLLETHGATGPAQDKPNGQQPIPARNHHPTVKSLSLMKWLVRLVTPPGGVVLDCFAGSGTTGMAAVMEGFNFVGIEQDAEYIEIARRRIAWAQEQQPPLLRATGD